MKIKKIETYQSYEQDMQKTKQSNKNILKKQKLSITLIDEIKYDGQNKNDKCATKVCSFK